ncbi:alpha/beta fold hydrolase [Acinetobacter sp.]|jgi:dienelactone hydrolase|uniref:alpha/beta hydrolase family protein n=1 Tax=Acinetobacter sp. TaxID=472 RepID=UPI002821A62A|nr:alpha/beta fold hydrolase [Acinetobacter sp.]MDR0238527.1 alpha/beta fold hydrolase [Acinetobacter sp.]MDR2225242.1 alpha/beta fold hydrolase [Providencia sp.]
MKKNLLTVLIISSGLVLTACNNGGSGGGSSGSAPNNTDVNNIANPVVGTPSPYTATDFTAVATDSVIMTYKMKGINGTEVQATSLVFTPKTAAPTDGWPIVVWAHGTTGVADQCAPSRNATNDYIKGMISKFLAAGYVVVAPDYEGLGEPGGKELHPFLNLKSEAYSITDAVVATRSWLGNRASNKWVTVGHSQGGQAALGAAQYAARANLDYKGTVAVAPASQLKLILSAGNLSVENATPAQQIPVYASLDTFTALIAAGLRNTNPTLDYSQVFKVPTDAIAKNAESSCDLGTQFAGAMLQYVGSNGSLKNYPRTTDGFMTLAPVQKFLNEDSQPLQVQVKTPVIIYQGGADTTVPQIATDTLYGTAKAFGTQVNYITNPAWDHGTAYALNIDNIVADVKGMFAAK